MNTDIESNRNHVKYSSSEQVKRVAWALVKPFFRFSPRNFFGWRNFLLRMFGAVIGKEVHIYNSAIIYMPWNLSINDWSAIGEYAFIYNLTSIHIGRKVTISQRAHLCGGTHDYTEPSMPLMKMPIVINDQAWVCTDAFIGPGVSIGEGAVIGARAVVVKDVADWQIVAGNPAKVIKQRTKFD